jgi:hypothetical protein
VQTITCVRWNQVIPALNSSVLQGSPIVGQDLTYGIAVFCVASLHNGTFRKQVEGVM